VGAQRQTRDRLRATIDRGRLSASEQQDRLLGGRKGSSCTHLQTRCSAMGPQVSVASGCGLHVGAAGRGGAGPNGAVVAMWSMRCAVATGQQGRSAGAFSHKLHLLLPLYYVKYRNLVKLPLT
jgi:hypothetical protein